MNDGVRNCDELWASDPIPTIRKFRIVRPAIVLLRSTKRFRGRQMGENRVEMRTSNHFVDANKMVSTEVPLNHIADVGKMVNWRKNGSEG